MFGRRLVSRPSSAVVNLYGMHLRVYRFQPGDGVRDTAPRLDLLHETTQGLSYPEDVAVAPNGRMLAVTHSETNAFGVTLHAVDPVSLAPKAPGKLLRRGRSFHGVNFSPDSRHVAFTEIGPAGYVEVMRVGSFLKRRTCLLENRHSPLKPKSVAFSHDGRFAVIGLSMNASEQAGGAMLSVHRFDAPRRYPNPSRSPNREMSASARGPRKCGFPSLPGQIRSPGDKPGSRWWQPSNFVCRFSPRLSGVFQDGLPFPHGVDVSADGNFVAVTNFTVTIRCGSFARTDLQRQVPSKQRVEHDVALRGSTSAVRPGKAMKSCDRRLDIQRRHLVALNAARCAPARSRLTPC
jgi:hypothetical protein